MRLTFSVSLLALGLAACAAPSDVAVAPAEVTAAEVIRDADDNTVRIVQWSTEPAASAVDIARMSPRPDAAPEIVGTEITDTAFVFDGEANERSYFSIETASGDKALTALRVLPLEGGRNFRDLGGYETKDGRTVKWGLVYRSGVLANLTDADYAFVDGLDIETVVDFRSTTERRDEPTNWRAGEVEIVTWDYESAGGDQIGAIFRKPDLTPEDVINVMSGFYRDMVYSYADKYEVLFDRLATTDAPLAFHCTAGKDRTGLGTALVLSVLGVPRETILEDYALSERVVDYMAEFGSEEIDPDSPYAFFAKLPPELIKPLMRSDPAYLEAALGTIEADFGSVEDYLREKVGVTDHEIALIRDRLLD